MGNLWNERETLLDALGALLKLYEEGAVTPQIDRAFPFQQASEAHAHIEAGKNIGKVLLTP
jgi:NADPH:quinone reductase-like Zn-dependent oxidoreductase